MDVFANVCTVEIVKLHPFAAFASGGGGACGGGQTAVRRPARDGVRRTPGREGTPRV